MNFKTVSFRTVYHQRHSKAA